MDKGTWPVGGGKTGELMRAFDWAGTTLGPVDGWPVEMRTLVELVLINPAPSALLWGADGILLYNDGYAAICGDRHPRALGATAREVWPEAWDFNGAMLAKGRAGQAQTYQNAHFVLERNGVPRDAWFDLYYAPVCGSGTAYEGVLATVVEITGRVQTEQARELATQRLAGDLEFIRKLFRSSPSFMAVLLGPDHRFELTNAAYDALIQRRVVQGLPIHQALPEVVEQGFVALLDRVYREGEPFHGQNVEVIIDRLDGAGRERRIVDFMYQPLKDDAGATFGILVEGIDVTDRALAEERLRVAQEAGEIGTFEWYPLRGELVVSDTYRRLWGIAPDTTVTDELLLSLLEPSYLGHSGVHRLGQMGNPLEYVEYPIRRADTGERRWIARKGQPVGIGGLEEPRYLGVAFDVTDRKHAEAQLRELNESLERTVSSEVGERIKAEGALRHAQKMEAVGQLASGIAHDFNNVLQIVSSNLQLIERDAALPARQAERVQQARVAVARGSRLSLQLLAFGRKQALRPAVTHLGLLLEDMAPLLMRALGDGIDLTLAAPAALWRVAIDRNQFENAVLNMAINARDAMQGSGRLEIRACNVAGAGGASGQQDYVALMLADSGCGMSADVLAKVFDPFYTTKDVGKGTGLGMSMVYGFVRQSGGAIRIESTPGVGTTITIELPRVDGEHEHEAGGPAVRLTGGDETILLVDDDPAVRAVTVDLLTGLGYRVLTAASGDQALDILKSHAGVDLLFSDVSMPGQVTSADLVREAAVLAPGMAVLLTSGHAVDASLLDARMPAGVALLPKPYSLAQLAQSLRRQLDGRVAVADTEAAPASTALLRILVVEDDPESRELACEMLQALGYDAHGVAQAEQALELLAQEAVDVLFTDLNLPGMSGDQLAVLARARAPALHVILASGEGTVDLGRHLDTVLQLPKPYDLLQLQQALASLASLASLAQPDPCTIPIVSAS